MFLPRLKTILLLLLALLIPLQGYATASMVFCASPHAAMTSAPSHRVMQVAAPDNHQMHQPAPAVAESGRTQDQEHTSCACTTCCSGMMSALLQTTRQSPSVAEQHIPAILSGFVGYTPENPERPPSTLM